MKALTPNLRFPEFSNGPAWDLKSLDEVSEHILERVGELPLTPVSISAGTGFVSQAEKFGRDISGAQYRNYVRLRKGDFSYNKGNSKRFPQGCVYELKEFDEAAVPNAFVSFRMKEGFVNGFFQPLFEKNAHGRELRRFITSGARSDGLLNVSPEEFFSVRLPVPRDVAEQRRIAECLTSLDDLIAAEGRRLEALRAHKKGLMQNLYPLEGKTRPRLRFPEFSNAGDWEVQRLEDLARRGSGHTPSKSHPDYYNGGISWISLTDSKRLDKGLITDTAQTISEEGIKNSSAVLHPAGTVVVSRDAGIGKSAVTGRPMAVSQHFIAWVCNPKLLSNWFLYHWLQNSKPLLEKASAGSTIKTIGLQFFIDLSLPIPSLPEQQRVALCLNNLDALIGAEDQRYQLLKEHKNGLLQQLFPNMETLES